MDHQGARLRISRRRRPGHLGYGAGGWMYGGVRDDDDRDDLTMIGNLSDQQFGDGDSDGGDGGGGDGGGGGE